MLSDESVAGVSYTTESKAIFAESHVEAGSWPEALLIAAICANYDDECDTVRVAEEDMRRAILAFEPENKKIDETEVEMRNLGKAAWNNINLAQRLIEIEVLDDDVKEIFVRKTKVRYPSFALAIPTQLFLD